MYEVADHRANHCASAAFRPDRPEEIEQMIRALDIAAALAKKLSMFVNGYHFDTTLHGVIGQLQRCQDITAAKNAKSQSTAA
jgi:hypothetical protein